MIAWKAPDTLKEQTPMSRWLVVVAFVSALPMMLKADTLVLRNGQRVQGEHAQIGPALVHPQRQPAE